MFFLPAKVILVAIGLVFLQENELLRGQSEEKSASLDELKATIEGKEKKLEDTIMQLMEVDALWLKTQNELEAEKAEKFKIIHDSRLAQQSRSKVCRGHFVGL